MSYMQSDIKKQLCQVKTKTKPYAKTKAKNSTCFMIFK